MSLRLLHPFTPFVTEELWDHLRQVVLDSPLKDLANGWPEVLIVARWPEPREVEDWEESKVTDFSLMQEIIRSIRNLRAEKNVAPSKRIAATIVAGDKTNLLKEQSATIASLAGLDLSQLTILESLKKKPGEPLQDASRSAVLVVGSTEIYLPLAGMVDLSNERARLEKELKEAQSQVERLEKLLGSDFANKAPEAVVAKEREKLAAFKETAEKLKVQLEAK